MEAQGLMSNVPLDARRTQQNMQGALGQFVIKASLGTAMSFDNKHGDLASVGLEDSKLLDSLTTLYPENLDNICITGIEIFGADNMHAPSESGAESDDVYVLLADGTEAQSLNHYKDFPDGQMWLGRALGVFVSDACPTGVWLVVHLGWMQP